MQKTAQKRSILNKLKEMTNVSGISAEKFFNPEFERVMNSLREADNKIRSVASGVDIEGEDAGQDPISLKDLLKNAKSNLNRREYMTAIAFLGRFHKKAESIIKFIQKLNFDVDQVHNDFLFKDLDEEQKKHLHEMKSRLASTQYLLVSEAGIMDFLANVSTERGRALSAWEKRYPKQVGKIKKDTASLLAKSESFLSNILSSLKEMASSRAGRKVDDYMKAAHKIVSGYDSYDKMFRDYYTGNIKGFLEKQELLAPTKKLEDATELGKQEVKVEESPDTEPGTNQEEASSVESNIPFPLVQKHTLAPPAQANPPILSEIPPAPASQLPPPQVGSEVEDFYKAVNTPGALHSMLPAPTTPNNMVPSSEADSDEASPDTVKDLHPEIIPPKSSHKKFMDSLVTFSQESPEFLANYISKYAKSIIKLDPTTAIQLLKVVKSIKKSE